MYLDSFRVHIFWQEFSSGELIVDPTNFEVEVHPICEKNMVHQSVIYQVSIYDMESHQRNVSVKTTYMMLNV